MKHLLALAIIPASLLCMEKTISKVEEKARLKNEIIHVHTMTCIEGKIQEDTIIDWPQFFKNIDESATQPQQKEYKQKLLQKVNPVLFSLANQFDDRELRKVVQLQSSDDGKKIITRDGCTVITMPEGVPNRIALNANGTALAINYANTLHVISKKHQWGNDTCERKQRFPLQSLAFSTPHRVAFTSENAIYSLDLKTKGLETHKKSAFGQNVIISHDGRHLFFDVKNTDSSCTTIGLKDLLTENLTFFDREKCNINGWLFKKFTANAQGNFVAATDSKIMFGKKVNDGYTLIKTTKRDRPPFIADCDIHNSGNQAVVIGNHKFTLYEISTDGSVSGNMQQTLHAVRFHPTDTTIMLATNVGIIIVDSATFEYRLVVTPSLRDFSVSADGDTLAAAGNDSVFILSRTDLKKSLSIPELMLIKRLATEKSEKVFSATTFIEIFKNIKNPSLQQRLVKVFKLNYQTLGYDECSICKDNFADTTVHSTHSFCGDCIEQWQEGNNTCPICRAPISE